MRCSPKRLSLPACHPLRAFVVLWAALLAGGLLHAAQGAGTGASIKCDIAFLGEGRTEKLDLYLPSPATARRAAIVWIHGGGWTTGARGNSRERNVCSDLAAAGYVCASIDYKLGEGSWPQNLLDCKNAIRFLRANAQELGIDPARIAVGGGSAGGHLAMMAAYTTGSEGLEPTAPYPGTSSAVRCALTLYGPANLLTWQKTHPDGTPTGIRVTRDFGKVFGAGDDALRHASPVSYITPAAAPTLILHGRADTTVDYEQSVELARRLDEAGVPHELVLLDDAGHTFDLQTWKRKPLARDLRPVVLRFLEKHLDGAVASASAAAATAPATAQNHPATEILSAAEFHVPAQRHAPHVMWHWVGYNITKEGITKDLESMKSAGIGGALIFQITSAGTGRFTPIANTVSSGVEYYNDKWFALFKHAAAEAQRLGLELGLHNCIGFSVSGGPWITPENSMQQIVWTERRITGPIHYDRFLEQPASRLNHYKDIAVLLVPDGEPAPGRIIDVTDKMDADGRLICEIPRGRYMVYRFGHTPTGAKPSAAPLAPASLEADKMSAHTMSLHMRNVLDPLKKNLGEYFGRSFKSIEFDSYEAGAQNWTRAMREEFRVRKGYDIIPWLPVLAGRIIESKESSEGFQRDLAATIADMFRAYAFELPKKMINDAGLEMQNEPYATGPGNVPRPFNTFDVAHISDGPTTEFWFHRRRDELDPWQVNAAIPFFGKHILSAEAFTGRGEHSRWSETPARLKFSGDLAFSRGVNRMVLHHWVHQPFPDNIKPGMTMGPWGTHFGRNQTWYEPGKAWLTYLARSQYLLQQGEKVSDFVSLGAFMPGGDVISEKTLHDHVSVKNRHVTSPAGRAYHLLALPEKTSLTLTALEKVGQLVEQGAVVFGPKPAAPAPSRDFAATRKTFNDLAERIWGSGSLPSMGERAYGKGKVLWGSSVEDALRRLQVAPSVKFHDVDIREINDAICWQHRTSKSAEIFYFSNLREKSLHLNLTLRAKNTSPEIWNPDTGEVTPIAVWRPSADATGTDVALSLKPNQTLFVVFQNPVAQDDFIAAVESHASKDSYTVEQKINGAGWSVKSSVPGQFFMKTAKGKTLGATIDDVPSAMTLGGAWKVEFKPPVGDSFSGTFDKLESWTLSRDERIKYFSGTAVYTKTFQIDNERISEEVCVALDLGTVREMAAITVNGNPVATLWHAPFEADITKYVKAGENEIRIAVTNTWANRLIGDNQHPDDCEWGWATPAEGRPLRRFPDWLLQGKPRPSSQRQAFSTWNYFDTPEKSILRDAGLLDAVKLKFWKHASFLQSK